MLRQTRFSLVDMNDGISVHSILRREDRLWRTLGGGAMLDIVVGIDVGTTSVKALAVDLSGQILTETGRISPMQLTQVQSTPPQMPSVSPPTGGQEALSGLTQPANV